MSALHCAAAGGRSAGSRGGETVRGTRGEAEVALPQTREHKRSVRVAACGWLSSSQHKRQRAAAPAATGLPLPAILGLLIGTGAMVGHQQCLGPRLGRIFDCMCSSHSNVALPHLGM